MSHCVINNPCFDGISLDNNNVEGLGSFVKDIPRLLTIENSDRNLQENLPFHGPFYSRSHSYPSPDHSDQQLLSPSETELSDTESAHQAMSLSSPEDGGGVHHPAPDLHLHRHHPAEDGYDTASSSSDPDPATAGYDDGRPAPPRRPRSAATGRLPSGSSDEDGEQEKRDDQAEKDTDRPCSETDYVTSCSLRGPSRNDVRKAKRLILELMTTSSTAPPVERSPEESDEQYARRVRKHNYLSMAQEFAARQQHHRPSPAGGATGSLVIRSPPSNEAPPGHEWAKNLKNSARCLAAPPANAFAKMNAPSPNQNAIHRHHQRSLAEYDAKEHGGRRRAELEPVVTSPTHVHPAVKNVSSATIPLSSSSYSYFGSGAAGSNSPVNNRARGLPANVAKMAAARNAGWQGGETEGAGGVKPALTSSCSANAIRQEPVASRKSAGGRRNRNSTDGRLTHRPLEEQPGEWASSNRRSSSPPSSSSQEILGGFDVYNIETTMPTIDWVAMEKHLAKAAKEEFFFNKHRRNNREEIRRKLAMGSDNDDYYGGERMSRKPSLQSRLQSGMNLQICFMNETVPDQDGSTVAEDDAFAKRKQLGAMPEKEKSVLHSSAAPGLSSPGTPEKENLAGPVPLEEATDILSKQAKLQAEARLALAQAKQMAHMQMEIEKQRKKKSPIAEMVGIPFPDGRHKVSRQALSEMNVAQLQVIVNDLHTQIENLNEELVRLLLERDDLHMEQDSMLVDIEDLTRYL